MPSRRPIQIAGAFVVLALAAWVMWQPSAGTLVVYCAHDAIFSEDILKNFERRTGIPVSIRFDTEATKSLGLVELLLQENLHPRCDVFWNNELLGTLQLAREGLLQPYRGEGWSRIPAAFKDAEGRWTGFAGRLRVWIINRNSPVAAALRPVESARCVITFAFTESMLTGGLGRVAIAKPLYGTTRSHYTLLWQHWGPDKLKAWHRDWRARGVREVAGNAMVKNLVAEGVCDVGLTDTDDFFAAQDEGKPVTMDLATIDNGTTISTICIPNTVSIIAGSRRQRDAQKLVDYLLSEEIELALARSKSRQIPLGPVDEPRLPLEVRGLMQAAQASVSWQGIDEASAACLAWLKSEYLQD